VYVPVFLCVFLCMAPAAGAYSVLGHEALIDAVWEPLLVPVLLERYPDATSGQVREARAYACGGATVQDMGYYPFTNNLFSCLTHYVRTGDFVRCLLDDSRDINEYAFALGALSHYVADNVGHALAVNLSVPEMYPELERAYGDRVTFEQDPVAHAMVEFSLMLFRSQGQATCPGPTTIL
jgi:hypothetical protein